MAVSKVKIASIIGVTDKLDDVIRFCGQTQYFHPDDALSFYSDTRKFTTFTDANPYSDILQELKSLLIRIGKDLDVVDTRRLDLPHYELKNYVERFSGRMDELLNQKEALEELQESYVKQTVEIGHFVGLNLDLKKLAECKYIKFRFGRIPKECYEKLSKYEDNPYVLFFQCTSDATHYWGVYIAPVEYIQQVDTIFSGLYFERLRVKALESTPEKMLQELQEKISELKAQIAGLQKQIDDNWNQEAEKCQQVFSKLEELDTYFNIRKYVAKHDNSFILTGWIPEEDEENFRERLSKIDGIDYAVEDASEAVRHTPPTRLVNKKLFKPFEFFVDMFGLPNYHEIDPTPFVAITYVLIFGAMFGDFGHGVVLSIVGFLMWRLKKMSIGRILIPCGISSALFGILFGDCFGFENTFNPLYQAMGFAEKPIHVMEPATTNYIIYTSVGVGCVMVVIAMALNIISGLKQKKYAKAIFGPNGVAGLVFYGSLLVGLVLQMFAGIPVMNAAYIICLIILPLLCIWFNEVLGKLVARDPDWKPEKWGDYIIQGFFETFETILSYATNTMSFLRVGAYVLVHAGMMLVVFTLAEMSSGIGYVLVLIVGNAFVMGLEALLVAIQVLRLEYYEMFSRFYDGDGIPFHPVTVEKH